MIIATIESAERVTVESETFTGRNAETDAARWLIGRGHDPASLLRFIWRNGTVSTGGTIAAYAAIRFTDTGREQWAPHPRGEYAPALCAWWAKQAAERAARRGGSGRAKKAAGDATGGRETA